MIGHEGKIALFKGLIQRKELRQAYLFFGDSQIGKSLFAKNLANFLERGEFKSEDLKSTPLIDFLFVSVAGEETIGIEMVKAVKSFLYQTPFSSPRRFVVIDQAEKLTPEAQSALLKIVEEPPEHGLIVFITHDPQVLFSPLLSRLAKIYFSRLSREEIRFFLEKRGFDSKAAERLAAASFGRIGRAIELAAGNNNLKKEENLEVGIQNLIIDFWLEGSVRNSKKITWLLDRETAVKRYNLNQRLQRRAIQEKLSYA